MQVVETNLFSKQNSHGGYREDGRSIAFGISDSNERVLTKNTLQETAHILSHATYLI